MIVTLEPDAAVPRVKVETTATTVYRVHGALREQVRGSVVTGVIYDYECPQETPVTYDDGLAVSALVELPDVGPWLIPPSSPLLGVPLLVDYDGWGGWSRPSGVSSARVPGRHNMVAVDFGRGARAGSVRALILDGDQFAALSACLDVAGPMFASFPVSHWQAFGFVSWVVVGDMTENPYGTDEDPTWTVDLPLTPVDRPTFVESMSGGAIEDLVGTISSLVGAIGDLGA